MTKRYLEVTFRDGKPVAAYLHLPRRQGDKSIRSERLQGGLVVDYAEGDRPIGIEITAPEVLSLQILNKALVGLKQAPATAQELAPLAAA